MEVLGQVSFCRIVFFFVHFKKVLLLFLGIDCIAFRILLDVAIELQIACLDYVYIKFLQVLYHDHIYIVCI